MNAPVTNTVTAVESARDFSFIKPATRRLTEYEAVTIRQQWETGGFDKGGHLLTPADGRAPWREESTALRHPDWFAFRDPAQLWQRPYVRMQAEQERAIERLTGRQRVEARRLCRQQPRVAGRLHRPGITARGRSSRTACSAHSRRRNAKRCPIAWAMRCASRPSIKCAMRKPSSATWWRPRWRCRACRTPAPSRRGWTRPAYQPLRRLVEQLVATSDWCEIPIATNLVILPLLSEVAIGGLVRRQGPLHQGQHLAL
ncbi:MAG: hypothetical protein IPM80_09100 [Proteobacteria bacterium]|nr:hypothetical protein [Pseudomonadota bacterium]